MGGVGSGPKPRYSVQQVREALRQAGGNVSAASRLLGCNRRTVNRYLRKQQKTKG
jgi:ActR/RegA family two-component response regulator